MLFYKVGPSPQTWWGELRTSSDGGRTWSAARRLPAGIYGPIKNKPVQLADGTILSPTSDETDERPSKWRVYFERSIDGGATWAKTPFLNDGLTVGAIQPSVLLLGGDKLQAVGRTRQGKVFTVSSENSGKSWGEMSLLPLANPNSGTDAVTLKDGRHLIVYNPVARGRTPLNVALSRDGREWQDVVTLEDQPGEYSYPAIIQTSDGRVHITYTWKRQRIRHAVIDPAKL
jgi:predicted neuraminidase